MLNVMENRFRDGITKVPERELAPFRVKSKVGLRQVSCGIGGSERPENGRHVGQGETQATGKGGREGLQKKMGFDLLGAQVEEK